MLENLEKMEAEVLAYCWDKGWYDSEVPFAQAMALLHEEAAEAGHAWRVWGLADATPPPVQVTVTPGVYATGVQPPKPEGVGSEFADLLIRLLDDSSRYTLNLAQAYRQTEGRFAISGEFLENINTLHGLIARASTERESGFGYEPVALAGVLVYLEQLCEHYGIDLMAEYTRKMEYNKTRAYRHGGRRA
jgi:NTP pyrophosphatase (non-canonical NTP hydrolase)